MKRIGVPILFLILCACALQAAPVAPWLDPTQANCWYAHYDFEGSSPPHFGGSIPPEGVLWNEGQSPLWGDDGVLEFRSYEPGQENHYLHLGVYDLPVSKENRYLFFEYEVSIPTGTQDQSHTLYETGPVIFRDEHFQNGKSFGRLLLPGDTTYAALTFEYNGIPPGASVIVDNLKFGFVENSSSPVPEPSSLLLLLGGLPFLLRKKK